MLDQANALIRHWLGTPPAEDLDTFIIQSKQARWLEERHYDALAKMWGVKK